MICLEANVTGGGTHFPLLDTRLNSEDRCEIIDCSGDRNGTTFRPIAGIALFWMNVRGDGGLDILPLFMPGFQWNQESRLYGLYGCGKTGRRFLFGSIRVDPNSGCQPTSLRVHQLPEHDRLT